MSNPDAKKEGERQREHPKANGRAKRLRKNLTPSESRLRALLKALNKQGAHFRTQLALGDFVFDFGDLKRRILIEVDGGVHRLPDVAARDAAKADWARAQGFQLLRFSTQMVFAGEDRVLREIISACDRSPHPLTPAPPGGGGIEPGL